MKAKIKTLGCRANQYDSMSMANQLSCSGIEVEDNDGADLLIINTCTVTSLAERKSCQEVRKAIRLKKNNKKVIVAGCSVRTKDKNITNIKGIDYVLDDYDLSEVIEDVKNSDKELPDNFLDGSRPDLSGRGHKDHRFPRPRLVGATTLIRIRSYLKIEEGCEDNCSYCIVPQVRGKVRSKPIEIILNEAEDLINRGAKEIVLTGISMGCYLNGKYKLTDVIKELVLLKELKRIRLSSIEPQYFDKELIKVATSKEKVCSYFHIPMQSGSDKILKRMGRRYKASDLKILVDNLRKKRSNAFISADIIVGFPGEEESDFQKTLNLIKDLSLSKVHVFRFSPRPYTQAENFPGQVDNQVKKLRAKIVNDLSKEQFRKFAVSHTGSLAEVLVEQKKNGCFWGHTSNYLKVRLRDYGEDLFGKFVKVELTQFKGEFFEATQYAVRNTQYEY